MAHAINKNDLVDVVLQGLGKPGVTIVPPILGGGFWYNSNIKDVEFDLAKANQVLEDAGYKKDENKSDDNGSDNKIERLLPLSCLESLPGFVYLQF
jgi:peptide/nickel transport system substrate-binding protein